MTNLKLTDQQRRLLALLHAAPMSGRDLTEALVRGESPYYTYDRCHAVLRRMEDRGLVRRVAAGSKSHWQVTGDGARAAGLS